jgi:DNA-binding GntR family transcriptional regulator
MALRSRNSPYGFLPHLRREERGGTVQRIQDLIRNAIVHLELPPGTFIDKGALCARLGVSRFPVSEALGRLADEGFVEVLPQRGTRVARIDLGECRQAMFIRRALEAEAMRMIAPGASAGLLAALGRSLEEQEAALKKGDRARFHELDLALHEMLLDELGYERVKVAVEAARASLDRMRLFLCTPQHQASTFAEHQAIVAALAAHDPAAAARAMEHHLDVVMSELVEFAASHPEAVETGIGRTIAA